jgi:Ca-activated chloride channel family protein
MGNRVSARLRAGLRWLAAVAACLCMVAFVSGCSSGGSDEPSSQAQTQASSSKEQTFTPSGDKDTGTVITIASGSENREAAAAIQKAADEAGVTINMEYMGSVDIKNVLAEGASDYDAVWPASSIWISMGDTQHLVKDEESTSTTPVVLGVKKSKAQELGWLGSDGSASVTTADIVKAVQDGKLTFAMTSATQSNSGASAYLAFLTSLAGKDQPLTAEDLANQDLQNSMKALLSGVDRSSGSSDWLKDLVLKDPDAHDAMVNYESIVIQTNKELTAQSKEPLIVVYPKDGIAVSDSPLGYIDHGQGKEEDFENFQAALASDDAKLELERVGRRTGLGGKLAFADDDQVKQAFNAEWGIVADGSVLKTAPLPAADVTEQALQLYQSALRKAAYTIWVVDYSGSMHGEGKNGVTQGLSLALDPTQAEQYMIQPAEGDVNILIPFSSDVLDTAVADGPNTADLLQLAQTTDASGGTNIYAGLEAALQMLPPDDGSCTTAIVLMTDGMSDDMEKDQFFEDYQALGRDIPIFPIMFGEADDEQLEPLADLSNGKMFDGRNGDLAATFRTVKGYN